MTSMSKVTVGQPAPAFDCRAVVDGRIKGISLSSYTAANHWLILVFFPRAWSFICPTEVKAFSARLEEFIYSRSCAVAFASTDSEYCLKAWNAFSDMEGGLGGVHVPLISDSNHKLCRDYGVLLEDEGVAQRALFIIDPKGIIRSITVNDADVGRSVDEAQRVLDALAFKDEFGEGCPVDWKKGDKGIDVTSETKSEGNVEVPEVRKSWAEWARPKLSRAFSGASQRSHSSSLSLTQRPDGTGALPTLKTFSGSNLSIPNNMPRSGLASGMQSGTASPMLAPTSGGLIESPPMLSPGTVAMGMRMGMEEQMNQALMQQRLENMRAAMANQSLESVGMAS